MAALLLALGGAALGGVAQLGPYATVRLRGGEAGLPQMPHAGSFGAALDVMNGTAAIGAPGVDEGAGAVWMIRLHKNGSAASFREVSNGTVPTEGGSALSLLALSSFGWSVAWLGDLDGDGLLDLAVGAIEQYAGDGSVYICFLNADLSLKRFQQITTGVGGFSGTLVSEVGNVQFGTSLALVPDLIAGEVGLAIGAQTRYYNLGWIRGTVFVISLNSNGTVRGAPVRIEQGSPGFESATPLDFGLSLALIPDIDSPPDGIPELAVGARDIAISGSYKGAIYILKLNSR